MEVGRKSVNRNEFLSSDILSSSKKNSDNALYSVRTGYLRRGIIQNGELLVTIQILATFVGQISKFFCGGIWKKLIWEITY